MTVDDLPLFAWHPPEAAHCEILSFPMARRAVKVRDVAAKLSTKRTARHIEQYRDQVTAALNAQLAKAMVDHGHREIEIAAFWRAVDAEAARLGFIRSCSGPGAA